MRVVSIVAFVGLGLFSAGLSGVGRVDQQVAQADVAAQQAAKVAKAKARASADCPWRVRHADREQL